MRIGLIGDSQAGGLAPHLLRELTKLGHELVWTRTQSGISTSRALGQGFFRPPKIDLAIVVIGGNDSDTDSYPATLREAAAELHEHAHAIVWVGPASSTDPGVRARHAGAAAVQRRVLPSYTNWVSGPTFTSALTHAPDGVHFVSSAYSDWADRLVPYALGKAQWWTNPVVSLGGIVVGLLLGALASRAVE